MSLSARQANLGGQWIAICLLAWALAAGAAMASVHEGVASCGGSTCHSRPVASGLVVRQNEVITWQDPSSAAGSHSRAFRVLASARSIAIGQRLGIGSPQTAGLCLGCHADPARERGPRFRVSDGVGCEACHGGSSGWLASHYTLGATHRINVSRGLTPLDEPKIRAANCLDCHFGSAGQGQFVSHQIMAAGHPRLSFELDLFSSLQRHYDLTPAYAKRKRLPSGAQVWAVGQAMALQRSLTLYADPARGQHGAFAEFYFYDCHSCHRAISDDPAARPSVTPNPARPIATGTPPYNDENMIMLSAAARAGFPTLATRFETASRAFHAALAIDRPTAVHAAAQLAEICGSLADAFNAQPFTRAETFATLQAVTGDTSSARYTDYAGGAQAVMAVDTLMTALVSSGEIDRARAAAIRPEINRAYAAVKDPNSFRPADFQQSMRRVDIAVRGLR